MSNFATIERPVSQSIDLVLARLDEATKGMKGPRPSQAWAYRETVRTKYGLPECGYYRNDPVRYVQTIEDLLKSQGIKVRDSYEFQPFFRIVPSAAACFLGPGLPYGELAVVVPSAGEDGAHRLRERAVLLAHEAVHAMQASRYPHMPFKEREREAYYYEMFTPHFILAFQGCPREIMHMLNKRIEKGVAASAKTDYLLSNQS